MPILCGLAGALCLALAGFIFGRRVLSAAEHFTPQSKDIWGVWSVGVLVRLGLLAAMCALFATLFPEDPGPALVTLACGYVVVLAIETSWLYRRLAKGPSKGTRENG